MIKRYSLPEMEHIWTQENRYECWLEVELAAARAMHELDIIPDADWEIIAEKADFKRYSLPEMEHIWTQQTVS